MQSFERTHVSDAVLVRNVATRITSDRENIAELLADLGEIDERRLFVPAGYSSMHEYCVGELQMSDDESYKRIQAARAAHRFPALFSAVADGRLDLTAVTLLAPHLAPENTDDLIAAAARKPKLAIKQILAQRLVDALVLKPVAEDAASFTELVSKPVEGGQNLADLVVSKRPSVSSEAMPTTANALPVYMSIPAATHENLKYAQSLLSHSIPSGDLTQVLDRVLAIAIGQLEKQKFAAISQPRKNQRPSANPRHIPAAVKRAVRQRDQGQCTFVGETGHRCSSRTRLEFDHIIPVACGGESTVPNVRLRCRAHNQYEAERVFGAGFMIEKRSAARRSKTERAAARTSSRAAPAAAPAPPTLSEDAKDIIAGLRGLGFRGDEARRAAEFADTLHDTTLEERMRGALAFLRRPQFRTSSPCSVASAHGQAG